MLLYVFCLYVFLYQNLHGFKYLYDATQHVVVGIFDFVYKGCTIGVLVFSNKNVQKIFVYNTGCSHDKVYYMRSYTVNIQIDKNFFLKQKMEQNRNKNVHWVFTLKLA